MGGGHCNPPTQRTDPSVTSSGHWGPQWPPGCLLKVEGATLVCADPPHPT